jgi:transcription elongation factor
VTPFQSLRVKNGWAMLTIDSGSLREEFWETGDRTPAWQRTHAW